MNIALIIAGGSGERMGFDTPKQFIDVGGHPVIAYTLMKFQKHPAIDAICVVVLAGWEQFVCNIATQYKFTKLRHITTGGATGQESIFNGLCELQKYYQNNDFVLIHDAVRPIIPNGIIDDAINIAKKYGNAVSGTPCFEAIGHKSGTQYLPHSELRRIQAPQCFKLGQLIDAHKYAQAHGIHNSTTSATLMIELGKQIFWSAGSDKNIKLTTPDDFDIFQAIIKNETKEYDFNI